jgi:hypothetical protein
MSFVMLIIQKSVDLGKIGVIKCIYQQNNIKLIQQQKILLQLGSVNKIKM